ncbi:LysR family transcriptional regulator [Vibrio paucivorans]
MDRLIAMRSFVEVANCASFTKAAENLDLSRLQVSRHVQEIETWLKQRLLHRTTRKVSLTSVGEQALRHCESILNEVAELEVKALSHSDRLEGKIRISAPIGLAQTMLLDVISEFTERHPDVIIEVVASDQFSQLVEERLDIALRYTAEPDDTLIARRLMHVDSIVCASPQYLQLQGEPTQLQDLEAHNCFGHLGATHWDFVKDNQPVSVKVQGNLFANDTMMISLAALRGKGIARLPCDLANPLIAQGKLVRILPEYTLQSSAIWAVYLSRSYQLPVVRQFIDFIAEQWSHDIRAQ